MSRLTCRTAAQAARTPVALAVALFAAGCADPVTATRTVAPTRAASLASDGGPGRYLVGLDSAGAGLSADAIARSGGVVADSVPSLHLVVLDGVTDPTALAGQGVRYVQPDVSVTLDATQGDMQTGVTGAATPADVGAANASAPWYVNNVTWDMRSMRADRAWAANALGAGARICIIDSGLDDQHQELTGKVVDSASFVAQPASVGGFSPPGRDSSGHGTHVAATAAGRGVVAGGVAPAASLMSAKVFNAGGSSPSIVPFIDAVVWCANRGAHVINMSLGGIRRFPSGAVLTDNEDYQAYREAMAFANAAGTVVVVSAGNSNMRLPNPQQLVLPAQTPGTIIVGATGPVTRSVGTLQGTTVVRAPIAAPPEWSAFNPAHVWQGPDGKAFYSNFGTGVDVFAPGGSGSLPFTFARRWAVVPPGTQRVLQGGPNDQVWASCSRWSTYGSTENVGGVPGNTAGAGGCANSASRYAALAGTSMAAPHVAGLAALLYAELGGARSPANRARVEGCIRSTTDVIGPSTTFGGGRVNAERAVAAIRAGSC